MAALKAGQFSQRIYSFKLRHYREFGNKIVLGHALRIYGAQTHVNLDRIREIRNACADAKIPILFETPEVTAVCAALQLQPLMFSHPAVDSKWATQPRGFEPVGKERYQVVCNAIGSNLVRWSLSASRSIDPQGLKVPIEDGYTITATRLPLP